LLYAGKALVAVRREHLVVLLRAVHRGELQCPITQRGIAEVGLLHIADDLDHVRGLDKSAVQAVLVAVIAERTS
jgi:hypothetical protein